MLIIHHTLVFRSLNRETFEDNYQLSDSLEEAREIVQELMAIYGDNLYCYSIAEVLESSELGWVTKKPEPTETLADNAWGTDK